jgi:DNA polymerase V
MSQDENNDVGISIHTGFPNAAMDQIGQQKLALDLNRLLVRHPSSTYLFRISGHQWAKQGFYDGDVAVVDRAPAPKPNQLAIAWQNEGFVICRAEQLPESATFWGVITAIIHQF